MARQKLTTERVRLFECPPDRDQVFLWDSEVPGLGVRATSGAKVFVFQGRLDGKTIRVKIGDVRTWVIDSTGTGTPGARQEARRLQSLLDQEIDPRLEKKTRIENTKRLQAEAKRHKQSVEDAWGLYLEDRREKWSVRHYSDHLNLAQSGGNQAKRRKEGTKIKPGPLSELMALKLSELIPEYIQSWARVQARERPARARLAFSILRAFINWCNERPEFKSLASPDACGTRIKKETIPRMKPKDDCLQREQLLAWFAAVRGLQNPVMAAYLQTLLMVGARREELAGLKWNDVDFKWNSMTIHDKVDGLRTIPLTPYVATLISPLPRRNEWVFSSPSAENGRLQEPRIPHNKALAVAGIGGLTLHGLRRSFGTLSEWVEVPAGVVAQLMGHKPSATAEKHYRRRPLDLLRMWHEKIEAWILDQAGIEQPKEVKNVLQLVTDGTGAGRCIPQ